MGHTQHKTSPNTIQSDAPHRTQTVIHGQAIALLAPTRRNQLPPGALARTNTGQPRPMQRITRGRALVHMGQDRRGMPAGNTTHHTDIHNRTQEGVLLHRPRRSSPNPARQNTIHRHPKTGRQLHTQRQHNQRQILPKRMLHIQSIPATLNKKGAVTNRPRYARSRTPRPFYHTCFTRSPRG